MAEAAAWDVVLANEDGYSASAVKSSAALATRKSVRTAASVSWNTSWAANKLVNPNATVSDTRSAILTTALSVQADQLRKMIPMKTICKICLELLGGKDTEKGE